MACWHRPVPRRGRLRWRAPGASASPVPLHYASSVQRRQQLVLVSGSGSTAYTRAVKFGFFGHRLLDNRDDLVSVKAVDTLQMNRVALYDFTIR